MAKDEWLDAEAAARCLRLPTRLIYAMVRGGQLASLQFPVRIRRQDLDACLERSRIKPGDLAHLDANKRRRSDVGVNRPGFSGGSISGQPVRGQAAPGLILRVCSYHRPSLRRSSAR